MTTATYLERIHPACMDHLRRVWAIRERMREKILCEIQAAQPQPYVPKWAKRLDRQRT